MPKSLKIADKQNRLWVKQALQQGWSVTLAGSGHLKFFPPEGGMIVLPSTPGDRRGRANARSLLRKAGLIL